MIVPIQRLCLIALLCITYVESSEAPFACDSSNPSTSLYPFCRVSLPITQRANDLVSRLTLDEKVSQLVNSAPAIPRLSIPAYEWWSEALHGVAFIQGVPQGIHFNATIRAATSFPQVILSASSFDSRLWYRIGQATGMEARAMYNAGQATGMTFWAPNINIFRDPRWGRGQETPGEDPLMTGRYAVSFVRGLQGDSYEGGKLGDDHLQASACCKHFTAYDLDHWNNIDRFIFDARVTAQDLADTYQPPFRSCIEQGKASGIMCAYNRVNGVPNCADHNLLSVTARHKWGFNGYITSDCDAVSIIHDEQGYAKTPEDVVADVLKAGMDVNCGNYLKNYTKSAIKNQKLEESEIDRALRNLFSIRMRLGLFNGHPTKQPYGHIGPNQVCSKDHQLLALEAARSGIVLLKNSGNLLPLTKSRTTSLAVIGPNANSPKTLLGNYAGPPCKTVTPLQALRGYAKNVMYHPGCDDVGCSSGSIERAVEVAKMADDVVLVMGLDESEEREDKDRVELGLPGRQEELIRRVARAAKKAVVVVLVCGGPVDVSFAKNDENVGGIVWAGYPGEAGGTAIAEIIFGDHNPGGRLPMTWYPQSFVKTPMTDMRMRPEPSLGYPGRTYRFYKGKKVFEFGYGLSYSNYSYNFNYVTKTIIYLNKSSEITQVSDTRSEFCESNKLIVSIGVKNEGEMRGKHAVLVFERKEKRRKGSVVKQMVGYESVELNGGERGEVEFVLNPCVHFSRVNGDGEIVMEGGVSFLMVGDQEYPITIMA